MDVDDLELLATVGAGVSLAHRSAMQSSLPLLRRNYKLSAVRAWGKLSGRTGDYLIASGIRSSWSEDKIFFFCADGVSWAQLPVLSDDESAACAAITGGLEGDIAHVLQGELREEHLLVYMVQQIESDAAVAPTGALVLHPSGGAVPNPAFAGTPEAGGWVALGRRKPLDPLRSASENRADFLMPAEDTLPKGGLVSRVDPATGATILRSLVWPGFFAFSKGARYGYFYCGDGAKNADVALMLS